MNRDYRAMKESDVARAEDAPFTTSGTKKPRRTSAVFKGQYQSDKALGCPFCGAAPILVPWHGGGPKKRNLMCRNEECPVEPSVCASTEAKAIAAWNTRP